MIVKLIKIPTLATQRELVDEWMAFLTSDRPTALETPQGEKTHVESVFSSRTQDGDCLYWYTVQDKESPPLTDSHHWIGNEDLRYWQKCIDPARPIEDLTHKVTMLPRQEDSAIPDNQD